jgi:serine/threonine protein kinase
MTARAADEDGDETESQMIGKTLAHYEITDQLGRGGMGEVWKARDTKLGREVAIKTLPDEFAQDADRLSRFEREAKLLASLNHPNIAAIYGLEQHEGIHFLVLELVEGDTLAEMLARGAAMPDQALGLAIQIVEALEAAHENGVIHRDLKPANIKVTPEGKVKVLDFGLAKAFTGDDSGINPANSPTLSMQATQQGMILGTAAYMSPEQAKGLQVDKRTDIFSFGCVLFEMLTGRQAFAGDMVSEILASVLAREPDYTTLRTDLHPRIRAILHRCFEKDPRKRWHAAGDLRVEIEQVLDTPEGSVIQPAPVQAQAGLRAIMPWAVAALVIGSVLAGGAVWLLKPTPATDPAAVIRFSHLLEEENFTRTGRPLVDISPDGTQLAYIADQQLYLRKLNESESHPVVGTDENSSTPFFSPDGESLGFWSSDNELKRIPVAGGTPVTLTAAANPYGVTWGADNTIVYGAAAGVFQVSGNGGTPVLIVESAEGEQIHGPQILPGGTQVLYSLSNGTDWDAAEIVVEDLETQERKTVWTGGNDARYVPTGHLVYAFENDLFALRFDLDTLSVDGGQVSMVTGASRGGTNTATAHYAISDLGTLVQVPGTGGGGGLRVLAFRDRDGNTEVLPAPPRNYFRVQLSPDQGRIAVQVFAEDGTTDIWIYEIQNDVLSRLTSDGGSHPLWTPDGEAVTYLNQGALWNIRSDFSGASTPLSGTDMADHLV